MELREIADDRNRLARLLLTGALTVVAIGSLRKGKRLTGALAGASAVALGYQTTAGSTDLGETLEIDSVGGGEGSAGEDAARAGGEFRCAACGEPIVPGQARGPNANNEIVHEDCDAA